MQMLQKGELEGVLSSASSLNPIKFQSAIFFREQMRILVICKVIEKDFVQAKEIIEQSKLCCRSTRNDVFNQKLIQFLIDFGSMQNEHLEKLIDSEVLETDKSTFLLYRSLMELSKMNSEIEFATRSNLMYQNSGSKRVEKTNLKLFEMIRNLEDYLNNYDSLDLLYFIGFLKLSIGFNSEALENFDEYIDRQRHQGWKQFYWRGVVLFQLDDFEQAHKSFLLSQNLVDKFDLLTNTQIVIARVMSLVRLNECNRAKGILEQFVGFSEKEDALLETFGDVFFAEGNHLAAEEFYQKATGFDSNSIELLFKSIVSAIEIKDLKKAKLYCKSLSKLNRESKIDKDCLKGISALLQNNPISADKYLKKAENLLGESSNEFALFKHYDIKLFQAALAFLNRRFGSALSVLNEVVLELNNLKQTLMMKKLETNGVGFENGQSIDELISYYDVLCEENNFNKAVCYLLMGKQKEFWDLIKFIEPSFYENLKSLEKNNLNKSEQKEPIKMNYFVNKRKINGFDEYFSSDLFGQEVHVFFSISFPKIEKKKLKIHFEKYIKQELHPCNFSIPLQHSLLKCKSLFLKNGTRKIGSDNKMKDLLLSVEYYASQWNQHFDSKND